MGESDRAGQIGLAHAMTADYMLVLVTADQECGGPLVKGVDGGDEPSDAKGDLARPAGEGLLDAANIDDPDSPD